jgi:hypothetical protein
MKKRRNCVGEEARKDAEKEMRSRASGSGMGGMPGMGERMPGGMGGMEGMMA